MLSKEIFQTLTLFFLYTLPHLPSARCLEHIRPLQRIPEVCPKLRREILILELGGEVFFHVSLLVHLVVIVPWVFPQLPEPLLTLAKAGHRVQPPMDEYAQLGPVKPAGQGPRVQRLPVSLICLTGVLCVSALNQAQDQETQAGHL